MQRRKTVVDTDSPTPPNVATEIPNNTLTATYAGRDTTWFLTATNAQFGQKSQTVGAVRWPNTDTKGE